jgi:hypothetical protein
MGLSHASLLVSGTHCVGLGQQIAAWGLARDPDPQAPPSLAELESAL